MRKSQWLILWRLVFISIFLLLTVLLQEKESLPQFPFSFSGLLLLIGLQYFFSILYILLLIWGKPLYWKTIIQLVMDGFFVTAVVFITGGIESFFPYLYFLIIVAGGTIFYRFGGLLTALYAGLLYGGLLFLQGGNYLPAFLGLSGSVSPSSRNYYLYQFVMHEVGFLCVGYFSSIFVEQTKKQWGQIEDQRKNIDQLEELNRIVIENLDIGLITLNHQQRILNVNPAGRTILGRALEEVIGLPLQTLFPGFEDHRLQGDSSPGNRLETVYESPTGTKSTLGFSISPVKDSSSHGIGEIITFKDISQIKTMEEHLRKVDHLAMLGKMAAGIAHEIRNPLASICGSLQVLKDDFKEERTGERLLKIIAREVFRLDSLMNDFLTFAKPIQFVDMGQDISEILLETVELIKRNQDLPSTVRWELDIKPNLSVKASAGELSQVFWNLLTNALQALPDEGKIAIRAQAYKLGSEEDGIEIKIKDNGPGVPPEDQAKIFEPFFTTKAQGTGLGLTIVQKIISDRGGRIQVLSTPGEGTEVILLFPK